MLQVSDIEVVAYRVESVRPRQVRLASHLYQELAWVEPKTRQLALEILFCIISEESVIALPFDVHLKLLSLVANKCSGC